MGAYIFVPHVVPRIARKALKKVVVHSMFLACEVSFSVSELLRASPLLFIGQWVFQPVLSPATRDVN